MSTRPNQNELQSVLDGCDYALAAKALVHQFKGTVIPNELSLLLDRYLEQPGFDRAVEIITFDAQLVIFFVESKPHGFFERNKDLLDLT